MQPGILPQGPIAPEIWPYITIVLDTSSELSSPTALNDRGFEVLRIFLVNTLIKYQIGVEYTLVSLVTFDAQTKVEFHFNSHTDWTSLYKALTIDWQYGPADNHGKWKNIDDAMELVLSDVYQPTNGAKGDGNVLWIFTTGPNNLNLTQRYQNATVLDHIKSLAPRNSDSFKTADYLTALNFIVNNISLTSNGKRKSTQSFATFLTASSDNNYSITDINLLNKTKSLYVTQVLCLDNGSIPTFAKQLASQETYAYNVDDLLDWSTSATGKKSPMQAFFADLQIENQMAVQKGILETTDVKADIIFVLDLANLNDNFNSMIQYFNDFTAKFTIGQFNAQFAGMSFGSQTQDQFTLLACGRNLTLGALKNLNENQLISSSGWRHSKTYILMFSAQSSPIWNMEELDEICYQLHNKNAFLYYVDMANGAMPDEMKKYFDGNTSISNPNQLQMNSTADQDLVLAVTSSYHAYQYPPLRNLSTVIADFVFVVDLSNTGVLAQVKDVLSNLLDGMNINANNSQVSLIVYNENGIISESTFVLNQYQNANDLQKALDNMNQTTSTPTTDFGKALVYLEERIFNNSFNGYRKTITFLTFINTNPSLAEPLTSFVNTLNSLRSFPFLYFYGFNIAQTNPDDVDQTLLTVFPSTMSMYIIRTNVLVPDTSVVNNFIKFIANTYTAFITQPITTIETKITTTGLTCSDCNPPSSSIILLVARRFGNQNQDEILWWLNQTVTMVNELGRNWNHFERMAVFSFDSDFYVEKSLHSMNNFADFSAGVLNIQPSNETLNLANALQAIDESQLPYAGLLQNVIMFLDESVNDTISQAIPFAQNLMAKGTVLAVTINGSAFWQLGSNNTAAFSCFPNLTPYDCIWKIDAFLGAVLPTTTIRPTTSYSQICRPLASSSTYISSFATTTYTDFYSDASIRMKYMLKDLAIYWNHFDGVDISYIGESFYQLRDYGDIHNYNDFDAAITNLPYADNFTDLLTVLQAANQILSICDFGNQNAVLFVDSDLFDLEIDQGTLDEADKLKAKGGLIFVAMGFNLSQYPTVSNKYETAVWQNLSDWSSNQFSYQSTLSKVATFLGVSDYHATPPPPSDWPIQWPQSFNLS
ncbi:unnamed protein product, partial [Mesorhabditis belari]|uniref:VWFA domain-containing protein n=1 Tax=Mesorhabditis belari TaxID=2138241 RepID=A0AAF3J5R9_9BILA